MSEREKKERRENQYIFSYLLLEAKIEGKTYFFLTLLSLTSDLTLLLNIVLAKR